MARDRQSTETGTRRERIESLAADLFARMVASGRSGVTKTQMALESFAAAEAFVMVADARPQDQAKPERIAERTSAPAEKPAEKMLV